MCLLLCFLQFHTKIYIVARIVVYNAGSTLVRAREKSRAIIGSSTATCRHNRDMLSPLKQSAPSAPLLRFLRSQSGFVIGSSACARPRTRVPCHEALTTGSSRRSSSWTRPDKPRACTNLDGGGLATSHARSKPVLLPATSGSITSTRYASTKSRPFLRRLFDLKRSKAAEAKNTGNQGPALIDEGNEGIFNIGRGLAAKASNELRIRCTEFDMNGNVTLVNGEFRKLELIAKVCIGPMSPAN